MATGAYHDWVAAGRRWSKAKPVAQLEEWAYANDVPMLGTIGDVAHLTASWPQDHTPFSATAWPLPLPGYIVTAIDLGNVYGIGPQMLVDARKGLLPWLKYLIFSNRLYSHSDGFQAGSPNSDYHIHVSIRTDHLNTDINYDPIHGGNHMKNVPAGKHAHQIPPADRPLLRRGDKGTWVDHLQGVLQFETDPGLTIDGDFGKRTHDATVKFQRRPEVKATGVLDTGEVYVKTWTALAKHRDAHLKQAGGGKPVVKTDRQLIEEIHKAVVK